MIYLLFFLILAWVALFDGEAFCRLKCRYVMSGDNNCCILGDVSTRLLCSMFENETSEPSEVDIFSLSEGGFYAFHECFHCSEYGLFVYSCSVADVSYDFCFCHTEFSCLLVALARFWEG